MNVDFTLLKRLVLELEVSLKEAEPFKADHIEYAVALSKTLGVAKSLITEATFLVTDISKLGVPSKASDLGLNDSLLDLFGPKKTSKN